MNSKEKAEELVNKFMETKSLKLSDYSRIEFPTAKQCALICCDEILSHMLSTHYVPFDIMHPNVKYWYEVK